MLTLPPTVLYICGARRGHNGHKQKIKLVVAVMITVMDYVIKSLSNIHPSLFFIDSETRDMVLDQTVTGILGEEVYLRCLYTGQSSIFFSSWNRIDSTNKAKKMASYKSSGNSFKRENFGNPASITNLTVKVNVTSFDQEGEYTCVFNSDEDETKDTMFLSVIGEYAKMYFPPEKNKLVWVLNYDKFINTSVFSLSSA